MLEFYEIEKLLRDEFEQARLDIIQNHVRAGQVASGRTRDSISVEVVSSGYDITATMYGRKYFGSLETGSKAWTKKWDHPPKKFVETIKQWMSDKGISGISAYLVARKIMKEGTKLYRDGGRDDIFSPVFENLANEIDKNIDVLFIKQIDMI